MKTTLTIIVVTSALSMITASAKEDAGRLEIKAGEGSNVEVIEVGEGAKIVNQSANAVTIDQPVNAGEWKQASLKFKTNVDTEVRIRLSARFTQADDMWVLIDNVKAEGIEVQNPDFEAGSGTAAPNGWKFIKSPTGSLATRINDTALASSGEYFVKVSHGSPVTQMVHVPKDTPVTITFSARSPAQ